jgi:hypothetical protein
MNQNHIIGGISTFVGVEQLSAVLQHFQRLDPGTGNSEAGLILAAGAGAYQLAIFILSRRASRTLAAPTT